MAAKPKKSSVVVGERKMSKAIAVVKPGKGIIKVNGSPIDTIDDEMLRLMIEEPLTIAGDAAKQVDIDINVKGGGPVSRTEAIRQVIALGIVKVTKNKELHRMFELHDRNMLVSDPRRTEPHKPSRSSAGPRRHKQRSKR